MFTIISRKCFRFQKPGVTLLTQDGSPAGNKQPQFSDMYFDTKPGKEGAFGDPQEAPDWIKGDRMWKLALGDKDVAEIVVNKGISDTDKAIASAQAQSSAAVARTSDANLEAMTKKQIVDHAKEVHGLELDENQTKALLISAVEDAREQAKA